MPAERRLILFAPSIHTGGGLVLLEAILASAELPETLAFVDARAAPRLAVPARAELIGVAPTPWARLTAQVQLRRQTKVGDTLLCFQGMPPLLRSRGRVLVFQQNRLMLGSDDLSRYSWRMRVQLGVARRLGRALRSRVATWFVQTPSMRSALAAWLGSHCDVRVVPFVGQPLELPVPVRNGAAAARTAAMHQAPEWDFVYVSDGVAHKNHRRLIEAWCLLAEDGIRPSLAVTLGPRDAALAEWIAARSSTNGLRVHNLGHIAHHEVLDVYGSSRALIFPSLLESFGLPLVEASERRLPILASERDYVRDVCVPEQSFDPLSPVSIARAVRRFLGVPQQPGQLRSASDFLREIFP